MTSKLKRAFLFYTSVYLLQGVGGLALFLNRVDGFGVHASEGSLLLDGFTRFTMSE